MASAQDFSPANLPRKPVIRIGSKAAWTASREVLQDRQQTLQARLSRLEELREQSTELAEEKLRAREPELAAGWDGARRAQRTYLKEQRRERQAVRQKDRSQDRGRGLEL